MSKQHFEIGLSLIVYLGLCLYQEL